MTVLLQIGFQIPRNIGKLRLYFLIRNESSICRATFRRSKC